MREHTFVMTHPPYLREKARKLRVENRMSLDEIAACLAMSKTTVWCWIKDLPDAEIKSRESEGRRRGRAKAAKANRDRAAAKRLEAYEGGLKEFAVLDAEPTFRDFVCIYIGEGYKRSRNDLRVANSDPCVIVLADHWFRRFATNPVTYSGLFHADHDPNDLRRFWSSQLNADPDLFSFYPKTNSGELAGRNHRSPWGVLTVRVSDTQFRMRMKAWIERVQQCWIDSARDGV